MDTIAYMAVNQDIMWIKHIGDSEAVGREFETLLKLGCIPTTLRGSVMRYDYRKVMESRLYKLCLAKVSQMTNVMPLSQVPVDLIEEYIYEYPAQESIIKSDRIDPDISMVILNPMFEDEIDGIQYACSYDKGDIFTPLIFMKDPKEYRRAIPMLTVAAASHASRLYGIGENIIVEPAFIYGGNGFRETIGEPEEYYTFCEYFTLGNDEARKPVIDEIERYNRDEAVGKGNPDFLKGYAELEEMGWISLAAVRSMRFMRYSDSMPDRAKFRYRENLKVKADEWGYDIDEINKLIDETTMGFFGKTYASFDKPE